MKSGGGLAASWFRERPTPCRSAAAGLGWARSPCSLARRGCSAIPDTGRGRRATAWCRDPTSAPHHGSCMATPSDELFPSIHFITELGALLGRHGYTPAQVPVAKAVGQAIPELVAFLAAVVA